MYEDIWNIEIFLVVYKTAASIFIDTSPENLIRNANPYVSWQNVCHISIHLNAQWKQQDGDLATVIVPVVLI